MKYREYNQIKNYVGGGIEAIINGGAGSGNFGHSGRPGKIGGSGKNPMSGSVLSDKDVESAVGKIAQKSLKKAAKEEADVTKDLSDTLIDNNASFEGLDFRLKGSASLARKIKTDAKSSKNPITLKQLQMSANSINDNLRYTAILGEDNFGDGFNAIKNSLESKGYEFVKVKNTMANTDGSYRGVNTQIRNKNGYVFELQFHTRNSFDVKMAQHINYEIARDITKSDSERNQANMMMAESYKAVRLPNGTDKIKSFSKV